MGDIIKVIVDFFKNKDLHIGYKLSIVIFILFGLFFVNDYVGFSRHYILNSKLEQIIYLKQIDPNILKNDSLINQRYLRLKSDILIDKSQTEYAFNYIHRLATFLSLSKNKSNEGGLNVNSTWVEISTMGCFYIFILMLSGALIHGLFDKSLTMRKKLPIIATVLVAFIPIYFAGRLYQYIVSFIPLITNYEYINFIIYFTLPAVALILFFRHVNQTQKNKAQSKN